MTRRLIFVLSAVVVLLALAAAGNYGASLYYAAGHGDACANCHEMTANVGAFHASPHHDATCADCHTAHAVAAAGSDDNRLAITQNCGNCHVENFRSFLDTYHGQVHRLGYAYTAK